MCQGEIRTVASCHLTKDLVTPYIQYGAHTLMAIPSTAGKGDRWLKKAVRRMTKTECKDFNDLTPKEIEALHRIRQSLALDALGYTSAEIEQILGLRIDFIYESRAAHSTLWSLAENDFLTRMRKHLKEVRESIFELISDGEAEALYTLRQVMKGGRRTLTVPGHPSLTIRAIPHTIRITVPTMLAAAQAFLKHIEVINQRILQVVGLEEAQAQGLEMVNDEFAKRIKEAKAATKERKVVKKARRHGNQREADYEKVIKEKIPDKDELQIQ